MARVGGAWSVVGGSYIQPVGDTGYDMLVFGSDKYVNFGTVSGETGYGFRDNSGTMQLKNLGGSWSNLLWGGGALGGSDTHVQYNDGGVFGGDANFTWDKTGQVLSVSDSSYMDIPQGSVLAWGAPSFRFGSHPDTGIASNGTNMAFWESGKIALNLADVLREFRVPSDYKFAFSAATNNNAASDTSFYRVQAGVLGTSGKFRVGIGASPSATLLTVSTTEQFRIAYDSFNYWSDTVAADGGRTIAGFGTDADLDIDLTGATDGDFSINGDYLLFDTSERRLVIKAASGQTANLFEIKNNSDQTMVSFDKNGQAVIARRHITNQDGYFKFVGGTNPMLEIRGDTSVGYYPSLAFYSVGGAHQGTIQGYSGLALNPAAGKSVYSTAAAVNTSAFYVKAGYRGDLNVPVFFSNTYQGKRTFELWQDSSIRQHGALNSYNRGLNTPTISSVVASGSGSSLAAGTYYYKVTAHNFRGETIGSNEGSVTITAGQNVDITWTVSPNRDGIDHFRVYRATSAGGYTGTSRISPDPTGVPQYLSTLKDTGQAAVTGSPPSSITHNVQEYRRWEGHDANFLEFQDETGAVLSEVRTDGSIKPSHLADADAANDSIYYSTDASKLVYKDSGGTVNNLY